MARVRYLKLKIQAQENIKVRLFGEMTNVSAPSMYVCLRKFVIEPRASLDVTASF